MEIMAAKIIKGKEAQNCKEKISLNGDQFKSALASSADLIFKCRQLLQRIETIITRQNHRLHK
jgi:hypothetical protein